MIDTTIYIGGFPIHEPTTVFTDYIISGASIVFYFKMKGIKEEATHFWSYFFLFMGLSSFVGSFSHALYAVHEGWGYKSFWLSMQVINGIAIYYGQQATRVSVLATSPAKKTWKLIYMIQLPVFIIAVFLFQNYTVTVIENALGLIPIMILHYKDKRYFARTIANGIAISFITVIVRLSKFSIHVYFNYNDMAHVFILASLYYMYKGARMKHTEILQD
jgi:hypothetical protein